MLADNGELGEDVFIAKRFGVWVDTGTSAGDVEQSTHFSAIIRDNDATGLAWWFIGVVAGCRDSVVFEVVPGAAQREGVKQAAMAMAGQDAGGADPKDVGLC